MLEGAAMISPTSYSTSSRRATATIVCDPQHSLEEWIAQIKSHLSANAPAVVT
jgi:hypothetical protein